MSHPSRKLPATPPSATKAEQQSQNIQLSNFLKDAQLDDYSLNIIRSLSSLSRNLHQSMLQVRRIQRGSPGARTLGPIVQNFQSQFDALTTDCQQVFTSGSQFPGMNILQSQLSELQRVLKEDFDDGGNEHGYSQRVRVLEKLHYANGMFHGVVKMIIENQEYWKRQCTNQPGVQRCLVFGDSRATPAITGAMATASATQLKPSQVSPLQLDSPKDPPPHNRPDQSQVLSTLLQNLLFTTQSISTTSTTTPRATTPIPSSPALQSCTLGTSGGLQLGHRGGGPQFGFVGGGLNFGQTVSQAASNLGACQQPLKSTAGTIQGGGLQFGRIGGGLKLGQTISQAASNLGAVNTTSGVTNQANSGSPGFAATNNISTGQQPLGSTAMTPKATVTGNLEIQLSQPGGENTVFVNPNESSRRVQSSASNGQQIMYIPRQPSSSQSTESKPEKQLAFSLQPAAQTKTPEAISSKLEFHKTTVL